MKYSELRKHKKHININKIKNICNKVGVDYIGIAFDILVLFNKGMFTYSVRIKDFNFNNVLKAIK